MKIFMVLTSHDKLGNKGENTGFWLEEFAAPYYVFKDAGEKTTLPPPVLHALGWYLERRGKWNY